MNSSVTEQAPTVVIGAGAAGLMAAIFAATGDRPVVLLERTRDGGRKILISGGGRCNVLPSNLTPAQYVTASSKNTLRRMLLSWPLAGQRRFFEEDLVMPLALEPETGKLFPVSNRARDVRDGLVARARAAGVDIRFETMVIGLDPTSRGIPAARDSERASTAAGPATSAAEHAAPAAEPAAPAADRPHWTVRLRDRPDLHAAKVIVATGGLSVPQTGSDGTGLDILESLGHSLTPRYPALTPLTDAGGRHAGLAGLSLNVRLTAPGAKPAFSTTGGFLFTHRGYSGPAVLDISHLAVQSRLRGGPAQPIHVQWTDLDDMAWDALLQEGGAGLVGPLVRRHLPTRLADALLEHAAVDPQRPLSGLKRDERGRLVTALARYTLPWTGDEGYRKAEVTGGGVVLGEVDPRTMQSRVRPGIFICGEALDAFGPIGGYNFAWAWATGRAAGLGAAQHAV